MLATEYNKVHTVSPSAIRPGWRVDDEGNWVFSLGGAEHTYSEWAELLGESDVPGPTESAGSCEGEEAEEELLTGFKWGVPVEVKSLVPGERGSWALGEILKVEGKAGLRVAWLKEESELQSQLVPLACVRPAAPPPPAEWATSLRPGMLADLYYQEAWWEVVLEIRAADRWKVPGSLHAHSSFSRLVLTSLIVSHICRTRCRPLSGQRASVQHHA